MGAWPVLSNSDGLPVAVCAQVRRYALALNGELIIASTCSSSLHGLILITLLR
jgi:hypothetical protein